MYWPLLHLFVKSQLKSDRTRFHFACGLSRLSEHEANKVSDRRFNVGELQRDDSWVA